MTYSNFFFTYFSLLALATFAICGWFAATRGWKVLLPNGKEEKRGKILKAWYFYWFQEVGIKKVYFEGIQLFSFKERIHGLLGTPVWSYGDARLALITPKVDVATFKLKVEDHFKIKAEIDVISQPAEFGMPEGTVMFTLYKEYPEYKYPEWIRDMMAGCITCHATIYGNIIFWAFALCAKYTTLGDDVYVFLSMSKSGLLFTWLAYYLSLAYTCTVAWQKMPD